MEPPSRHCVRISASPQAKPAPRKALLRAAEATLAGHPVCTIDVLLTDDDGIRAYNRQFRGLDEPTDVLSFVAPAFPGAPLGEIVISRETASRQAAARGVSVTEELCWLLIHGTLHLQGLDDETPEQRAQMWERMAQVGRTIGLSDIGQWVSLHEEAV